MTELTRADRSSAAPLFTPRAVAWCMGAGAAGLFAFTLGNRVVGPAIFGPVPEPIDVAMMIVGARSLFHLAFVYLLLGLVVLPAIYVLVLRPLSLRMVPDLPWWLTGIAFGGMIWLTALAIVVYDVPEFWNVPNFPAVIWSALVGHLGLGLAVAGVAERRPR